MCEQFWTYHKLSPNLSIFKSIKTENMKSFLTVALLFLRFSAFSQGINFVSEDMKWQDVLAKAKAENKIVFVDAYTTWCSPCKWMAKNIFPTKEVGDVFNASFVNAKIDMEKGEGVDIAKKYAIRAYPTYIFVNGDGELVHRSLGSKPADKFIDDAKAATDPNRQFYSLKKRFEKGENTPEFLKNVSLAAEAAQEAPLASKASEAYMATQKDWTTPENSAFIMKFATTIEGKLFAYLVKNKSAFEKTAGKAEVEMLVLKIGMSIAQKYFDRETKTVNKEQTVAGLAQYMPTELVQQMMAYTDLKVAQFKEDPTDALKEALNYFGKYSSENPDELNLYAWMFYEKSNDPIQLQKAVEWSLKSIQLTDNYAFNDTAASLYFKLGNKQKAKVYAEKAIGIAKESQADAAETEALLKKIEAMQ
jgi:thiol-disulfide isomerase/thioredoxin